MWNIVEWFKKRYAPRETPEQWSKRMDAKFYKVIKESLLSNYKETK